MRTIAILSVISVLGIIGIIDNAEAKTYVLEVDKEVKVYEGFLPHPSMTIEKLKELHNNGVNINSTIQHKCAVFYTNPDNNLLISNEYKTDITIPTRITTDDVIIIPEIDTSKFRITGINLALHKSIYVNTDTTYIISGEKLGKGEYNIVIEAVNQHLGHYKEIHEKCNNTTITLTVREPTLVSFTNIAILLDHYNKLFNHYQRLHNTYDNLKTEHSTLKTEYNQTVTLVKELDVDNLNKLKTQIQESNDKAEKFKKKFQNNKEKRIEFKDNLDQCRIDNSESENTFTETINNLESQIQSQQKKLQTYKTDLTEKDNEIANLQQQLDDLQQRLNEIPR